MTQYDDPNQYIKNAEQLFSEVDVENAINTIAQQLNAYYREEPPLVFCVMGGAVVFTGLLLPKLTFPLAFDYVQATRYHDNIAGKSLQWIVKPSDKVAGRKVLILDDILDEGITLKAVIDECKALGASEVKVAVLVNKKIKKDKPLKADYIGLQVDDRYIFGCGMDVYGWWRNTKAIYAMKTT